ncbi:CHASE domain-containing protein [Croceicoccus gelatinilyticus]|uniref:CHASE domain-containing protein n=1 Tax=Croceicoccus gelatinilyticus TaxID=2835536 RepID=UPI001BCB2E04|nr:CHASE domain-containing protein [Croceicoccus gelatinilyticus]
MRDIVLLAAAYFVAGYVGISMAVPPGYATIVWPASGVAFCALLLRGNNLWPGIWLGSFLFNTVRSYDSSFPFEQSLVLFATAAIIGVGGTLQAYVGSWLVRRSADSIDLSDYRQTLSVTFKVIVLPCLIAPTIGVAALLLTAAIGLDLLLDNWLTWFSGDVLGVALIFSVFVLSRWSPISLFWSGRKLQGASPWVATSLAVTLLLTFYAWQFLSEREYRQADEDFSEMAANTDEALRYRLQIYERALESGSSFVALTGGARPSEWREYVERMNIKQSYPGMRGFGIFEEVAEENFSTFRDRFANEYGARFEVHPRVQREKHFVITRIEPLSENLAALGLDLAFEEGRREAIALSTTQRTAVLTRPIVLVQDTRQGAGFLLIRPVFSAGERPTGQWIYAPLVAEELFSSLTPQQGSDFAFEVLHHGAGGRHELLYASDGVDEASQFSIQREITLAGQPFLLRWKSLPAFERRSSSSAPTVVLVSGLAITFLLGALLVTFLRRESHVVREVSEATAELAERNRMLELAEATAHIGHWQLNLETNALRWSDEVHRLHGLEPGKTPHLANAIDFYHPEDRSLVEDAINEAKASHTSYQFKARLLPLNGEVRHVEVRGRVERMGLRGDPTLIGVIIDRTDETLMRSQLTASIEDARAADKAKSSFLANMSHEIRTPMNGVIGFAELALAEEKDPEQKRRLRMIAESSQAMLRLLNDLLDFAKIEAKQMAIVNEPTDLRHTLRSCQNLMEPVAERKDLSLVLEVDPSIPSAVLIDKMRLRQIVLNLVGNALKFTEKGEVRISASLRRGEFDGSNDLRIVVQDTGVGIPKDRLERIFDKFSQADETTSRRYGGTGLGLPISAQLAELMGGSLCADSILGLGARFTLDLPFVECNAQGSESAPLVGEGLCDSPQQQRLNILVAEDNPINQVLIKSMVEKSGHHCTVAKDGKEAVDATIDAARKDKPYDMVLMDMQMPEMDGLEACAEIRKFGIGAETLPIIAITANAYADDIQRCTDAGMQAHLAKPIRLEALRSIITKWTPKSNDEDNNAMGRELAEPIDPRLQSMFAERIAGTLKVIQDALQAESITGERKKEVSDQLHQIAGVAAYFGEPSVGELCRIHHENLKAGLDAGEVVAVFSALQERFSSLQILK